MTPQYERIKELEAKWPPRVLFLASELKNKEPHDSVVAILKDEEGYIHPTEDVEYISLEEHAAKLTEAQAEIERLRGALEKVFYAASPGASRNEWVCFKAADEALAKYAEGKDDGGGV